MSAMSYREPNQVKWVGIRPGHNGTQVAIGQVAVNATNIIYTVTAGKTFYLSHAQLNFYAVLAAITFLLYVRDGADVGQYNIISLASAGAGHLASPCVFYPPIEIPAGWDIVVSSNSLSGNAYAFIHGWEE